MENSTKRQKVSKIYCDKCDSIFESREKYDEHYSKHDSTSCEACPLDVAIQKIVGFFKRK